MNDDEIKNVIKSTASDLFDDLRLFIASYAMCLILLASVLELTFSLGQSRRVLHWIAKSIEEYNANL